MARFKRRGKKNQVHVYYSLNGKQHWVPRADLAHLDYQSDDNVKAWVQLNAFKYEGPRILRVEKELAAESGIGRLIDEWARFRLERKGRSKKTVQRQVKYLKSHVIHYFHDHPNFANEQDRFNPNRWPHVSLDLLPWLEDDDEDGRPRTTFDNRAKALQGLSMFWDWLRMKHIVLPVELPLIFPRVEVEETPLSFTVGPDDILRWADQCTNEALRFIVLTGFFLSLRPFEICALRRRDFHTGLEAQAHESCRNMAHYGMFDKMVVEVTRQRIQDGSFKPPKSYSKGTVACFSEEAAIKIRTILLSKEMDDLIVPFKPDWNFKVWRREGYPGLSIKDLRRASIYWLGHDGRFDLIPLMNHARHAKMETTKLYCRRPFEGIKGAAGDLSW